MSDPIRFAVPDCVLAPENAAHYERLETEWLRDKEQLVHAENLSQRGARLDQIALTDRAYHHLVNATLVQTPALKAMQEWEAGFAHGRSRPCLILSGGVGCGKTVASAWYVLQHGGHWARAEALTHAFAAHFGEERQEAERALSCAALIVDDVGTETDAQRMLSVLLELFEGRKTVRKKLVLTTNLTRRSFCQRYPSDRITSRMHESIQFVGCGSDDLRARGL